jgi:hypothetical protein
MLQISIHLLLRAVGRVEADMLITMGAHQRDGMAVGACPNYSACIGTVSTEKQSPGDSTSCPGTMHT